MRRASIDNDATSGSGSGSVATKSGHIVKIEDRRSVGSAVSVATVGSDATFLGTGNVQSNPVYVSRGSAGSKPDQWKAQDEPQAIAVPQSRARDQDVTVHSQTMTRVLRHTGILYWMSLWDNSLLSKAYAEFMGCMIFHFIGSVAPTAIANAVALTTLVFYTAKISGGHLNPAVTLTFCILGHTDPLEMFVYWMAQVAGCIAGAMWIAALIPGLQFKNGLPEAPFDQLVGCVQAHHSITNGQVLGWEAVGAFCFIVPVFSVVWYTQNKSGYGSTGPIMVGIALYAVALAIGDFTGALVNPARTVASDAIFACGHSKLIPFYIVGQVVGACLAPLAIVPWYGLSARPWYGRTAKHMYGTVPFQQPGSERGSHNNHDPTYTEHIQSPRGAAPDASRGSASPFADFYLQSPTSDEHYDIARTRASPNVYGAPSAVIAEKRYTCATPVWTADEGMTVERGGGSARRARIRFVKNRPGDVETSLSSRTASAIAGQQSPGSPPPAYQIYPQTGSVSRLQRTSMTIPDIPSAAVIQIQMDNHQDMLAAADSDQDETAAKQDGEEMQEMREVRTNISDVVLIVSTHGHP